MSKIKKILVVSELKKEAFEVLEYGVTMGLMMDAQVHCIHVVQPTALQILKSAISNGVDAYARAKKDAMIESSNLLSHILDMVTANIGVDDLEVDLKLAAGRAVKEIIGYTKEINADMVVVGAHVDHKNKENNRSSLALDLINDGSASILVVPSTYAGRVLDEVCLFINFDMEALSFISEILKWTASYGLKLTCIHVVENEEKLAEIKMNRDGFRKFFIKEIKENKINIGLKYGPVPQVVQTLSEDEGIDLMIMRGHRSHWNLFMKGSTFSGKVLKNIEVPLLVWKKKESPETIVISEN